MTQVKPNRTHRHAADPQARQRPAPSQARHSRWRGRLADGIRALVAEQAGPSCIAPSTLDALCAGTDPASGTLHVACTDVGRALVIGVSLGRMLPTIEVLALPKVSSAQLRGTLESFALDDGPVGLVQAVIVLRSAKAPTLVTTLLNCAVRDLYAQGARIFVYPHRMNADAPDHRRALARRGFYPIATLPAVWQPEHDAHHNRCRRCPNGCTCTATLYVAYAFGTRIVAPVPATGFADTNPEAYTSAAWPARPVTAQLTLMEAS